MNSEEGSRQVVTPLNGGGDYIIRLNPKKTIIYKFIKIYYFIYLYIHLFIIYILQNRFSPLLSAPQPPSPPTLSPSHVVVSWLSSAYRLSTARERDQWEMALLILANRKRHSFSFLKLW